MNKLERTIWVAALAFALLLPAFASADELSVGTLGAAAPGLAQPGLQLRIERSPGEAHHGFDPAGIDFRLKAGWVPGRGVVRGFLADSSARFLIPNPGGEQVGVAFDANPAYSIVGLVTGGGTLKKSEGRYPTNDQSDLTLILGAARVPLWKVGQHDVKGAIGLAARYERTQRISGYTDFNAIIQVALLMKLGVGFGASVGGGLTFHTGDNRYFTQIQAVYHHATLGKKTDEGSHRGDYEHQDAVVGSLTGGARF